MAEWLRRLTRNQMGSSRVGSNPTCSEVAFRMQVLFNYPASPPAPRTIRIFNPVCCDGRVVKAFD